MAAKPGRLAEVTSTMATNWSTALPRDLLENIIERVDLADHARLSAVCKWWRCVAADLSRLNKPFSLVRSRNPASLIRRLVSSFWTSWDQVKFVGSGDDGWLVLEKDEYNLFLINPATGAPPIPLPHARTRMVKIVLSSPPPGNDCMIVQLRNNINLYSCTPGDPAWCLFYEERGGMIIDIIYYKDRLYTLNDNGRIKVFDSGFKSKPTDLEILPLRRGPHCLVNAFDKLLVVESTLEFSTTDKIHASLHRLFRYDPKNSSFIQVESIGDDNILFISPVSSVSVPARDYKEFQSNHLYELFHVGSFYSSSFNENMTRRGSQFDYENGCPVFFILFSSYDIYSRS